MVGLIIAESAIFTIFVVAYLFYLGKEPDRTDAARRAGDADLLHDLPAVQQPDDSPRGQVSSSAAVRGAFLGLWLLTIALGGLFLFGTAQEWHRLIYEHG